ncbi:helix-turn-helix domain-containing protein [Sphingobacterium thalpophilum]|uniref:helix-turn-helix domain-containing protein n=1 Tax=Sphingobacterium thalpophilum TaxID=259 RepID=UPI002D78B196|nr:AraC family transcriptional regulator [Sphingobacterium thalpophilum]
MLNDYKKYDLFGRTLLQKIDLKAPFHYDFPIAEQACFLYVLKGVFEYQRDDNRMSLAKDYALLLNCIQSGQQIQHCKTDDECQILIVTFNPDILKKVYDRELPYLLRKPRDVISNKSAEMLNNDILIKKYVEGLLFYFENPLLVNDDILILKLKEILLLLAQSGDAATVQLILSQLFSPDTYSFKQIIEANLFAQLTIEQLAAHCNLSISSFKREFARLYQDTPANYIKHKKLQKAADLLVFSEKRITDIAFECGFNDLATFTKNFTDAYHIHPTGYRQAKR